MAEILQEQRAEVARIIGEEGVKIASPEWLSIMQRGVVVELHVRRWRGRSRLDFSDLGLPGEAEDDLYSHLVSLGYKKLLPKKANKEGKEVSYVDLLDALESKARKWLDANSYATHWGRFVPYTKYAGWKEGDAEIRASYFELRDEISDRYDEIRANLRNEYEAMAKVSYRRNAALLAHKGQYTEARFVEKFLSSVMNMVPSAGYIYDSFGYETDVTFIPLPSQLEEDLSRAREIRLKEAADRAMIDSLERMNDDVLRQARVKKEKMIDQFLLDVTRQIRSSLYEAVTEVLASIKKNGKLVGKSSAQLSNIIESVSSLNFYGDRDITQMVSKMRDVLAVPAKDRSAEDVAGCLREVGVLTRASLIALGEAPRTARNLGIPETPSETLIRKARKSLSTAEASTGVLVRNGRR